MCALTLTYVVYVRMYVHIRTLILGIGLIIIWLLVWSMHIRMYICMYVSVYMYSRTSLLQCFHELHQNFMVTVFVLVVHTVEPLLKALPIKDTI